jgi:hypothetical protein
LWWYWKCSAVAFASICDTTQQARQRAFNRQEVKEHAGQHHAAARENEPGHAPRKTTVTNRSAVQARQQSQTKQPPLNRLKECNQPERSRKPGRGTRSTAPACTSRCRDLLISTAQRAQQKTKPVRRPAPY